MDNVLVALEDDGSKWVMYEDYQSLLGAARLQSEDVQTNWASPVELKSIRERISNLEEYCSSLEKSIARMIEISDKYESCGCDRGSIHDCICPQCAIRYVSNGYLSHINSIAA